MDKKEIEFYFKPHKVLSKRHTLNSELISKSLMWSK